MLQLDRPGDFVVASGETHSIRELCEVAFGHVGLDWTDHVVVDKRFYRPAEVDLLIGDASHARAVLGWNRPLRNWCARWSTPTSPPSPAPDGPPPRWSLSARRWPVVSSAR